MVNYMAKVFERKKMTNDVLIVLHKTNMECLVLSTILFSMVSDALCDKWNNFMNVR